MNRQSITYSLLRFGILIVVLGWGSLTANAQVGGQAGSYTRFGSAPRAMAAGNSWVAYPMEGAYVGYNPAFAAFDTTSTQINLSTALLSFDRQLHILQTNLPLPPSAGLGLMVRTSRITDFDGRSVSGYPTGSFSSTEFQVMGAFGLRLSDQLHVGAGFKYNFARLHPDLAPSNSIGLDLGLYYAYSERLQFGLSIQDLLSFYQFDTQEIYGGLAAQAEKDRFPIRLRAGSAVRLWDDLRLTAGLEFQLQRGREIAYRIQTDATGARLERSTNDVTDGLWQGRLGLSYPIHPMITLRTGWQGLDLSDPMRSDLRTLSGGFTLRPPLDKLNASIDYAILREPSNLGFAHVLAIQIYL
jgi:hypothetical protein